MAGRFQPEYRDQIAGPRSFDPFPLVCVHLKYAGYFLAGAFRNVQYVGANPEHPGVNPQISQLAALIHEYLERKGRQRFPFIGLALLDSTGQGAGALDRRYIERRGEEINDCVQKRLHALVFQGAAAKHRNGFKCKRQTPYHRNELRCRNLLAPKIALHQLVIEFAQLGDQIFPGLVCRRHKIGVDLPNCEFRAQGLIEPEYLFH